MTRSLSKPTTQLAVGMIPLAIIVAFSIVAISPTPADCFPWSIDMYRGPEIQPLAEAPRVTPADTLPVHGGEPPMSLEQATLKMHNPIQPTAQNLAAAAEESDFGYEQGSSRRLYLRSNPRRHPVDACLCGGDPRRAALAGRDVPQIDAASCRRKRQGRRKIGAPSTSLIGE